jgi:Lipocalin-like domain
MNIKIHTLIFIFALASCGTAFADEFTGRYFNDKQPKDYITLNADGTYSSQVGGTAGKGTYTRGGATITLAHWIESTLKLDKNTLVFPDGSRKTKKAEVSGSEITGTYFDESDGSIYITLNADGTFSFFGTGPHKTVSGTYTRDGAMITITAPEGESFTGKLDKNTLVIPDGSRWTKKAEPKHSPVTPKP